MLTPFGDRFFRSGQVLVSVPRFRCGQGQPPRLGAGNRDADTHRAVLPAKPVRRHFRFPLAACGSLGGRRESLSYFYLLAAKEEKPPQPSCAMQQGREPRSLVSEPEKVIASLTPIPEKPLIYVSANFEALSNLDKL